LRDCSCALFFIWHFPFYSGDTAYYEELGVLALRRVYGFYSHGQLLPTDARTPVIRRSSRLFISWQARQKAVMLVQAFVDLATCVLPPGIARAWQLANLRRIAVALPRWHFGWRPLSFTGELCRVPLTKF